MNKFTESEIETFAIDLFDDYGHRYVYASERTHTPITLRDTLLPKLMSGDVWVAL